MTDIRHRSANYTHEEKMLLFNTIHEFKQIIENKKTDAMTWKDKEIAWKKITEIFNAKSPNLIPRTKDSLKKFYENKKKELRKIVAQQRTETLKTGGGNIVIENDPTHDILLNIVNEKTVCGLSNKYDGDQYIPTGSTSTETSSCATEPSSVSKTNDHHFENHFCLDQDIIININEDNAAINTPVLVPTEISWDNYNPTHLKTPVSKQLKQSGTEKENEEWIKRRRPTSTIALNSSHLSKQYSELALAKLELAKIQTAVFKAEAEAKQERDKIEFELRKRSLELDIEIKQNELRKLLNK